MSGSTEKKGPDRYRTSIDIRTLSVFTPGAHLCVELELCSGARSRQDVRVETGRANAVFLTSSPPVRATLDPDSRWLIPEQKIIEFSDAARARRIVKEPPAHAESQ
jgi:hypothetical protein